MANGRAPLHQANQNNKGGGEKDNQHRNRRAQKKCKATIKKNDSSQVLEQMTFYNNTDGIGNFIKHIKERYRDTTRAVCESTANYWIRLHDALEEHGIDTLLANPVETKAIAKARIKDDKIDSNVLADLLRADMVAESFVPDKAYRDLRNLIRTRLSLVHSRTSLKNKIHAILAKYDYIPPAQQTFSQKGIKWLRQIELSEIDRMTTDAYLDEIDIISKQVEEFTTKIASISSADDRTRLLMTIPGIDYITALSMISEIVDITRFSTPEKLVSWAGLAPSRRDSADVKRRGGITRTGSRWLRNATVEAATTAIRHDQRLANLYTRISARRGPQKAKVVAAREMLVISWHMLTKMEPYRTQNHSLTQRKYKRMEKKSKTA